MTDGEQESSANGAFQDGLRLLASGDAHAAAVALERARDLEPEQGSVREALARAYFRSGRHREAAVEFERAVELDPVNDYAHFGLGLSLLRVGDRGGARRHLKLAVAMQPRDEYCDALAELGDDS
jgi:Flp pilus assembly protein TadD